MNIQELEDKHNDLKWQSYKGEEVTSKEHTKLSVEFAISVLEEVNKNYPELIHYRINDKIKELKQYLDE